MHPKKQRPAGHRCAHSLAAGAMRKRAFLVAAATAPIAWPLDSRAASDTFTNVNGGNWSTAANWSLGHQPGNLDDAIFGGGQHIFGSTVTYDAAASATNLNSLTLDYVRNNPLTLSQAGNT